MVLLVAAAAFFWGRLSAPSKDGEPQMVKQGIGERQDNVMVSRDMVAWLDAARFFTQLGMEERATLSYKQASELIPYDVPANQQAGFESQSMLADVSSDRNYETLTRIMAQSFGGWNHEY